MSESLTATATAPQAPAHVPPDLVVSYHPYAGAGVGACPHVALARLHEGPRTVFNVGDPFWHPSWVPTRAEDIRAILQDPETFSAEHSVGFSALIGETWSLIPSEVDPPAQSEFRALLNPLFSPKRLQGLEPQVHARAAELIDRLADRTECEFMAAFARAFPVSIFLELMGLPIDNVELFSGWMADVLHGADRAARSRGASEVATYLRQVAAERAGGDGQDVISVVVNARFQGRSLTDDEIIGMLFLIFGGGIDTVAASLGFHFLFLAQNPGVQARLRADPTLIPDAVEEFLRAFSLVSVRRQVRRDIEMAGVSMKAGDWVQLMTPLASLDPAEFDRPLEIDITRSPNRHTAFSFGPHRCLGSHLARRELAIALETWLTRLPPFRLAPGDAFQTHGGLLGVDWLNLVWD